MCGRNVVIHKLSLILALTLLLNSFTVAFATEYEDTTVPVETTTGTEGEDVFEVLAGKDTMQDVAAYLNYKRLYKQDIQAIEWSFVLSQLAKPFEESLSDVMSNDIVKQMRDQNLVISNTPDVIDSDYVYLPMGGEYSTDSVKFTEVWTTITKNIRYNSLLNEDLQHYTVKSFLKDGVLGKQGFISDYIFTDKDGKFSSDITKEELKNNIEVLYDLESESNSTKIIEYLRNPSLSLTKDPNEGVRGQRRLVPVFVGSEISNMYIQIGMMVYCKENTGDSMTFSKFLQTYGTERVFIDSYGNVCFFDSKENSYKIILPNACNTVFTSSFSSNYIELYGKNGERIVDKGILDDTLKAKQENLERTKPMTYPKDVKVEPGLFKKAKGWSEETFIYNKLLGSVYSTKRRLTDKESDGTEYGVTEEDLSMAHYTSYIGPNVANRTDFRNSLVLAQPDYLYLSPNLYGTSSIANAGSTVGKWFLDYLNPLTATEDTSYKYVPKYNGFISYNVDAGNKVGSYLNLDEVLLNSIIPNGTTIKGDSKNSIGTYASVKHAYSQEAFMAILQIANDASIIPTRNLTISDADSDKSDGAIAFPIHQSQLTDVSEEILLGPEGGFLSDYKNILDKRKEIKAIRVLEYEALPDEEKSHWTAITDPLGGIKQYIREVDVIKGNYSSTYLLKRDNRISNRYSMFPLDDIVTLSHVWISDYIPKMGLAEFKQDSDVYNSTQQFLSTAANQGTTEDIVAVAVDTGGSSVGTLDWCDYSMIDTNKTEEVYTALKTGEEIDVNPFSRSVDISTRALWMGLYRNTDSVINPDSPIKFTEKEKTVDVDELLRKINFGIDNPLTKVSNIVSGLCQLIHNSISVGSNSNTLAHLLTSDLYKDTLVMYVAIGTVVLVVWFLINTLLTMFNRRKVVEGIFESLSLCVLLAIVPLTFSLIVNLNTLGFKSTMQSANDKATLVAVQKTVDTFVNKSKTAEANYMAYRQQFSSISDIYQPTSVQLFDSISKGEPQYKSKPIDEIVNTLSMKLSQEVRDGAGKPLWYTADEFVEVQKQAYAQDFSRFFYDYMLYKYLQYYNNPDLASTSFGSVASQIGTDDKDVAQRIDKVLHNLKGGFNRFILDPTFSTKEDMTGIAKYMNSYVTVDTEVPYLRAYSTILEGMFRKKFKLTNSLVDGIVASPYGKDSLTRTEPWRSEYYKSYEDYLYAKPQPDKVKFNNIDMAIDKAYTSSMKRIKSIAEYRVGEFSDTSLIYTSSLIVAQELAKELGDVVYGVADVSDLDKLLRVIYSTNSEDIYNEEATMYIIQDRVSGGMFIALFLALYELCYILVTFINIIISVFASFILPLCVWFAWRRRTSSRIGDCFIGMVSQVSLQLLSLYIMLAPLAVMSKIANKPLSSITYWVATLLLFLMGLVGLLMSLTLFKAFISDMKTMGGSVIRTAVADFTARNSNATLQSGNTSMDSTLMNIGSSSIATQEGTSVIEAESVDMVAEQNTLQAEEIIASSPSYECENIENELDDIQIIS